MSSAPAPAPAPGAAAAGGARAAWAPATICAAVAAAYAPSLGNGFVYDDWTTLLENPWIRSLDHLAEIFGSSVSGFLDPTLVPNYYRPLVYVYDALVWQVVGARPMGWHALNLVLHAAVALLVYALAAQLGAGARAPGRGVIGVPLLAALLFAVHPLHVEAVDYVAACSELLFALFLLASLVLYARARRMASPAYLGSVAAYAAATLSKEPALALPLLLLVHDAAFRRGALRTARGLARHLPFALITAGYLGLRVRALGGIAPYRRHADFGLPDHALNAAALAGEYARKLVLPTDLSILYPFRPATSPLDPRCVAGFLLGVAALSAWAWSRRRAPPVALAIALCALPLLPALYASGVGESALADRYAYVPSVGFALLLALGVSRVASYGPRARAAAFGAVAALLAAHAAATVRRHDAWRDETALWTDAARKAPDHPLPWIALGDHHARLHEYGTAIASYRVALEKGPPRVGLLSNLGIAQVFAGRYPDAERTFRAAALLAPDDPRQLYNLGLLYARWRRHDEAIAALEAALRLEPSYAKARASLEAVRRERSRAGGEAP